MARSEEAGLFARLGRGVPEKQHYDLKRKGIIPM